jgi:hypothetical protein
MVLSNSINRDQLKLISLNVTAHIVELVLTYSAYLLVFNVAENLYG